MSPVPVSLRSPREELLPGVGEVVASTSPGIESMSVGSEPAVSSSSLVARSPSGSPEPTSSRSEKNAFSSRRRVRRRRCRRGGGLHVGVGAGGFLRFVVIAVVVGVAGADLVEVGEVELLPCVGRPSASLSGMGENRNAASPARCRDPHLVEEAEEAVDVAAAPQARATVKLPASQSPPSPAPGSVGVGAGGEVNRADEGIAGGAGGEVLQIERQGGAVADCGHRVPVVQGDDDGGGKHLVPVAVDVRRT